MNAVKQVISLCTFLWTYFVFSVFYDYRYYIIASTKRSARSEILYSLWYNCSEIFQNRIAIIEQEKYFKWNTHSIPNPTDRIKLQNHFETISKEFSTYTSYRDATIICFTLFSTFVMLHHQEVCLLFVSLRFVLLAVDCSVSFKYTLLFVCIEFF